MRTVSLLILLALIIGLPIAVWLMGLDPLQVNLEGIFTAPNAHHWLGTDDLGRDVLARLAGGVQVSLMVASLVLIITMTLGVPLGLLAGWFGGWVDVLVLKFTEAVLSFPGILLALALAALTGGGVRNVVLALGILGWVGFCRLARVQVQQLKALPYVDAAKLAGTSVVGIWGRHLLPGCVATLLVEALLVVSGTMVAEAGLSFLGLGIPAPLPSLGGMLRDGMRFALVQPLLVVYPALVLIGLTLTVNVLAQGLRQRWADGNEGPQ